MRWVSYLDAFSSYPYKRGYSAFTFGKITDTLLAYLSKILSYYRRLLSMLLRLHRIWTKLSHAYEILIFMRYGLCIHPSNFHLLNLEFRGWRIIQSHSRESISDFTLQSLRGLFLLTLLSFLTLRCRQLLFYF